MRYLFLLFYFLISPVYAATMIFNNGFESGTLSGYQVHAIGGTVGVAQSPVATGNYSGKFDLQFGSVEADNYRSEVQIEGTKNYFTFGKEYWFSFNYIFTDWVKDSSPEFAPFQIHARPSSWDDACRMGSAYDVAPFFMMTQNDQAKFVTYGGIIRWTAPVIKNQWQTITVRFKPSTSSTGYIEAWHNGNKILSVNGANQPVNDGCGGLVRDPYWNMGLYKWDWRTGRPATQSSRRTFYIDDLKVAEGTDGYNLVYTPTGTPSADTTPPVISNINSTSTETSCTVTWNTNEAATSKVDYGLTASYGNVLSSSALVTNHSIMLGAAPPASTLNIPPEFFGMHYTTAKFQPWPLSPFKTLRSWDQYPSIAWNAINTSPGVYDWTLLDLFVNTGLANNADIVYVFGKTPQWASQNPSGGGCTSGNGSCYAPKTSDWQTFVTAITNRYKGKIKYWEIWNEPNSPNFWSGTTPQMVTMAQAAYPIIKAADPNNMVLSPSPQGAPTWLDAYFAGGGKSYTDIIAWHAYLFGPPEEVIDFSNEARSIAAKHGLSSKEHWDTEHSWGIQNWPFGANEDQQAAWLGRFITLSASLGVKRTIWYLWDGYSNQEQWGMLYNRTTQTYTKAGIAYNNVYNWLINANIEPCTFSANVRQCRVFKSGNSEGLIVWASNSSPSFTAPFTVPAGYVRYRTLDGTTVNTSGGSVLTLTMKPIFLEKDQTAYHYKVTSVDSAGNTASSSDRTCGVPQSDTTPPIISSITVTNITSSSATVNWTTNEVSDNRVDYGTTTSYSNNVTNASMVTSHSMNLTSLNQGATYNFKVTSKDPSNNSSSSANQTFTTSSADTTPPVVSNVATSNITGTDARITWTTNESSDSRVDYGTTTAYGSNKTDATKVTSHTIDLIGLTPGTVYNYKVSSKDTALNNGQSANATFTTLDTVAPVISGVSSSDITTTSAIINWTTNKPADGVIDYGVTTSYGGVRSHTALLTIHRFDISGLQPGTQYQYRITSKDAANNSATSANFSFTTASPSDVTPPSISGVNAVNLTNNTATIVWVTDETSDSLVEYGTSISYGSTKPDSAFVQNHSVTLTSLLQNTTYHYRVKSKDGANNTGTSTSFLFTTSNVDTVAPAISNVSVTPTGSGATVTWSTDEPSNSSMDYGLTTAYGSNKADASIVVSHSLVLTGLAENTLYNYKLYSTDSAGNTGNSANLTFKTLDVTAPTISNVAVNPSGTSAVITWSTNEAADSLIDYGLTSGYGSNKSDAAMVTSHSLTLTGLTENTNYHYQIISKDSANNSKSTADLTFQTVDTTKPVLSNLVITPTSNSIEAAWDTNEPSNSRLKFGSPITDSVFDEENVTSHKLVATGLFPSTLYSFKVQSTDSSGNQGEIPNLNATTSGLITPAISNITESNIGHNTFTAAWTTDIESDSLIEYGLTNSYGSNVSNASQVTSHELDITGLTPFSEYHYRVCSTAQAQNCSSDRTFVTDALPSVTITSVQVSPSKTTATITWTTDGEANSEVQYGLTSSLGLSEPDDAFVTSHSVLLTGLSVKKKYYFKVRSAPVAGEFTESLVFTFNTRPNSGMKSDKFGSP